MASLLLAACVVTVPLLAVVLSGYADSEPVEKEPLMPFVQMLRQAFAHGSYLLLLAGFFVCGFHVAFITTHLPAYLNDIGGAAATGAWAIGLIGLFNIIGAYTSGMLGGKFSKRYLLSGIYLGRALAIALFVTLPPKPITTLVFAAVMGLLWLSTVPLTSGLVAVMFGTRHMATLFGFVFLSHQVGAFLGAWLGGLFYERTGSYDAVWWLSVALGLFAAVIHWPIAERAAPQLVRASA
jgi:predicted MFS family arabinose efflux permease